MLRKRRWILIAAVLLGLIYGAYKAFTQPKLYEASSTIEVHNGASNAYKVEAEYDYSDDAETKENTEVLILKSETLLATVAREMNLANNPDFWGVKAADLKQRVSMDDPRVRESVVGTLEANLQVALVPRSELIRITYSSLSPKMSAEIVNQVVADYVQRAFQTPVAQTQMVSTWLSTNLDQLKAEVERAQEQMMELERKMGTLGYGGSHTDSTQANPTQNQVQSSLEELLTAEGEAKVARITAESRYRMIAGMDPNTIEGSIETTPGTAPAELNILRGQLATVRATYSELGATLGANNPRMKELQDQISELTKEIDAEQSRLELQAKETYLAAKATEDKTEQELDARKAEAYKQGDDVVRYTIVQREYEQNRTLYDALLQRLETAKVEAGLDALEVDQVDAAIPPVSPTLKPKSTIILTTTLFFLLAGVVVAFIVESLDSGLHDIQEIEGMMGMPALALIPKVKRSGGEQVGAMSAAQRNMSVLTQPKSQFTESFRSLRTSLLLATAGKPPRFILFTSATPSEGKTTTASNLACILSQSDARVLLIDADLRRPNVHHRFGLSGKLGLTTVLAGASTFEEALQHLPDLPNLDILASGPVPPFPSEMLSSDAMNALLQRVGSMYSHVVIDSPPILSVTDAVILAHRVDAVVLVIRHGKSNKGVLRRTRDLLARSGAPIAGLVLNAVELNSPEYYGYYGYSGYSYGSMDAESWETQSAAGDDAAAEGKVKR